MNSCCTKAIVPYCGKMQDESARLVQMVEFFGICIEPLLLDSTVTQYASYIEDILPKEWGNKCLVLNARVLQEWTRGTIPEDLIRLLVSRFRRILVHGLEVSKFSNALVSVLSNNGIHAVQSVGANGAAYEVSPSASDICGPFAGLVFGSVDKGDQVLSTGLNGPALRSLIGVGGRPLMALVKRDNAEILFLAPRHTASLNCQVRNAALSDYFSSFVPHAMAIRYIFGDLAWQPGRHYASVIIDDPYLRRRYGFLEFESLRRLMEMHNFHSTIAFIPRNYRRSSRKVQRLFWGDHSRFAICFHGNDHTCAEFASTDVAHLNTMVGIAQRRMEAHQKRTGIRCGRVMVFPQGSFSRQAMSVLRSSKFHAAVNTIPYPEHEADHLTIAEIAQPALLKFDGFPLFIRRYSRQIDRESIAFNLYFGRPILIVEHHDIFKDPEPLIEAVGMVNAACPDISWSSLDRAVEGSFLRKWELDGTMQVRAYSSSVCIENESGKATPVCVEWPQSRQCPPVEEVREGGVASSYGIEDGGIRWSGEMGPDTCETVSLAYRNDSASSSSLGLWWNAKAFARRRLSEVRDNYISRSRTAMKAATHLHHLVTGRGET